MQSNAYTNVKLLYAALDLIIVYSSNSFLDKI